MTHFRLAYTHIKTMPQAFWVVICASFLNQAGNMAFVFLVIYLNQNLAWDLTSASLAFALNGIGMVLAGLVGGVFIDKIGAARMMVLTLPLNGLVLFIFPFLQQHWIIFLASLLWGILFGLYRSASQTFVSLLSTPGMHKITFSVYRLVINLGMSIGPAIGGYLATHAYKAIFFTNSAANILASIILIAGLARTSWFRYQSTIQHQWELSVKWLKHDASLRLFVLGMIPVSMIFFQHESTVPIFLNYNLQLPLSFYGLLFTLNTLIIVIFELPLNVITMSWSYRANFILGSVLITTGFAGLYFATLAWHVILLTVIWTAGEMIFYPSTNSYIADIAPAAHRGSYMSLYNTTANLGLLLGPWSGAIIMQHYGAQSLWLACGLWGIISIGIFAQTKKLSRSE